MKQKVNVVKASIKGKDITIMVTDEDGSNPHNISVTYQKEKDDILFKVIEALIDSLEKGAAFVLRSNDPRAKLLYTLNRDMEDKRWLPLYEGIIERDLAVGAMSREDKTYLPPIKYNGNDFVQEMEEEEEVVIDTESPIDVPMDILVGISGQLKNEGRLLIDTESSDLLANAPKANIEIDIYKSISFTSETTFKGDNMRVVMKTTLVGVGETRLSRIFGRFNDPSYRTVPLVRANGKPIRVQENVKVLRLVDTVTGKLDPLIIFEGAKKPRDFVKHDDVQYIQWQKSIKVFKEGLDVGKDHYQFCFISAAGQRTITAVFIRTDVKIPDGVLDNLPEDYKNGSFSKLSDLEKIWDLMSYGGYLKLLGTKGVANKVLTRFGTALSTTIGLGPIEMRTIGRVIAPLSDMIVGNYRELLESYGFDEARIEKNIGKLTRHWKEDVVDGSSLITAEAAAEMLNLAGIRGPKGKKWTAETAVGLNLQFRYAFVKGMCTAVPRELLWNIGFIKPGSDEVTYPYRGFDLVCEANSVKNEWNAAVYTGDLAPQFELVGMSKDHGSRFIDPQLVSCLYFETENDPDLLRGRIKQNIDEMVREVQDIRVARVANGVIGRSYLGDEELSPYGKERRSILEGALQVMDQESGPIEEPFLVKSIVNSYFGSTERSARGKFAIDGERWHLVPDISLFWKSDYCETDTIDFVSGLPMFDLIVSREDQVSLPKPGDVFACGKEGRLAMYRNPLNRPGEIVFSNGVALDNISDEWANYIYGNMRSAIVLSPFSLSANLMGGGDYDGDLAMVIWDKQILGLLRPDDFVLVDVDTKANPIEVNYENLKNSLANSLCDAGIGLATNYGSTWTELAHVFKWFLITKPKTVRLPKVWMKNKFTDDGDEFRKETLWSTFLYEKKNSPMKGLSILAKNELTDRGLVMPRWEKEAAEAIAYLKDEKMASLLKKETLTYQEFEILAGPFLKACEGGTSVVRYIQELAINTAKSDVWAFYERTKSGELVGSSKYDYIAIRIRPYWKRNPVRTNTFEADYTPMGVAAAYTNLIFEATFKGLMSSSAPIESLSRANTKSPLYQKINVMVKAYNDRKKILATRLHEAMDSKDEGSVLKEFGLLNAEFRVEILPLMYSDGISEVLKCAYTSTYKNADRIKGSRMSFVYGVLAEEFLVWLNNSSKKANTVSIPVSLVEGMSITEGTYQAEFDELLHRAILLKNNVPVGLVPCRPDGGRLDVFIDGDRAFAQAKVPRVLKSVANRDFGHKVSVLGLKDYGYTERKIVESFRAKMGMKYEGKSFVLGEHQDIVRFVDNSRVNAIGIEMPIISMTINGEVVGNVAPEFSSYVRKIMSYGDAVVVEWVKGERGFSLSSARVKIVDVISR